MTTKQEAATFGEWAILELMGRRRLAGYVSEAEVFGTTLVRIDVPDEVRGTVTQFYSPSSIYCLTPTTEDTAREVAKASRPAPIERWQLPPAEEAPF